MVGVFVLLVMRCLYDCVKVYIIYCNVVQRKGKFEVSVIDLFVILPRRRRSLKVT